MGQGIKSLLRESCEAPWPHREGANVLERLSYREAEIMENFNRSIFGQCSREA
jgi:hypothetical protein